MIEISKSEERGTTERELVCCKHSFSFADYRNEARMSFHYLRVANEDVLLPGGSMPAHPHQNIEILTYVVSGQLSQKDSFGKITVVEQEQVQLVSAGTGILHEEFNAQKDGETRYWQFLVFPHSKGLSPTHEIKTLERKQRENSLVCIASPGGRDNSMIINQRVRVYLGHLDDQRISQYPLEPGRVAWMQIFGGILKVNQVKVSAGDSLSISEETLLNIQSEQDDSEFILFDMLPSE